jgi:gluconate 2-dehydrogenase alpha chain
VIVGSGPGGSTAAMALARAGWDVTVLEKGRNHFTGLESPTPETRYSNDELKMLRGFGQALPELEPRTFRYRESQDEPVAVGDVNTIPGAVGGGTTLWDAKVPRFWDVDFKKRSLLGPVPNADVVDWPFAYEDLAPYYDAAEDLIGVAGDVSALPGFTMRHAPRTRPFPMPPGVQMRSSLLLADGARRAGLHPYPFMEAVNSVPYDGRPPCIHCGHCSFFGCPVHDRGSALVPLRHALRTGGAELLADTAALRVVHDGRRAKGVLVEDVAGRRRTIPADVVVLAAGAVDTARLALLSGLPDRSGLLGRNLMFHWVSHGYGIYLSERIHANVGRNHTQAIDDFADPDFEGARDAAKDAGLPYLRGGVVELGGTSQVIQEALRYADLLELFEPDKPFGVRFKELMRLSPLRDRMAGLQMIAEDLAQPTNRVDLDPRVRDRFGLPAARITYSPHKHELAAQDFYLPRLKQLLEEAGADAAGAIQSVSTEERPSPTGQVTPTGSHLMGGLRCGDSPTTSVTDPHGRLWDMESVCVADAGLFATSGAHNPTLTIMATAWRNARAWAGVEGVPELAPASPLEPEDVGVPWRLVGGGAAVVGAVAAGATIAVRHARADRGTS